MFELDSQSNASPAPPADLEQALRLPVGAASPLWFIIGGAASAGMAYWWATRWIRPFNLEAAFPAEVATMAAPVGGEAAPIAPAPAAADIALAPLEQAQQAMVDSVAVLTSPEATVTAEAALDDQPVELQPASVRRIRTAPPQPPA